MRHAQPRISVVALSWKGLVGRFMLALLMAASLAIFLYAKTHADALRGTRFAFIDLFSSVTTVIAKPADAMHAMGGWVRETLTLREENARLRQENERLKQWQLVATELGNENDKLRQLMRFAPTPSKSYISARVALSGDGPFGKSAIINAGSESRVQDDLAVIDSDGLVGRVLETGKKTSRVLLITDASSRIPVLAENSRERAIAMGDNNGGLTLLYLPDKISMKVGERIVTTSDGAVLPPGLAVGVITAVEKNKVTVQPYMDSHRLEYVSVVDFGM